MKQIKHYILGLLVLLSMSACQKDEPRISFGLQVADRYNDGDGKVYMDGYKPKFIEDEAIKINGETYLIDIRGGSPAVYDVAKANDYYAIYPASWANGNASSASITFPDMQKYKYDETLGEQIIENPMVAYANSNGETLRFYNVASLAKVQIKNEYGSPLKVKYVALYTDDTPLSGPATIKYFNTDTAKVRLLSGITNVSIDCSELPALADGETKEVTFALPPIKNVVLYVDVYMTSADDEETTKYSFTKKTANGKTINRSEMGVIKVTLSNTGTDAVKTCGLFWGSGTSEADPFIIMNKTDLIHFKDCINNDETYDNGTKHYNANSTYYLQTANIDISDQTSWMGIGTSAKPFKAKYDGSNAWIKLNIENLGSAKDANDGVGLFAFVGGGGEIKNLTAKGNVASQGWNVFVGGIIGKVVGAFTIDNCYNEVPLRTYGGSSYTNPYGGVCGHIDASGAEVFVKNCTNNASITRNTYGTIGGICGSVQAGTVNFISNTNTGTLTGTGNGTYYTGGICGYCAVSATFVYCENQGDITSESSYTGGIVGLMAGNANKTIVSSTNSGSVHGAQYVGGIVGSFGVDNCRLTLRGCKNILNSSSSNDIRGSSYVGGIYGAGRCVTITSCANYTPVSGTSQYIGGIVGALNNNIGTSYIDTCLNTGAVSSSRTGSNESQCGGIIGQIAPNASSTLHIRNCANRGNVSAPNAYNGLNGGLVGLINYANVTVYLRNCYSEGTISGKSYTSGLVGKNHNGKLDVENCFFNGTVSGTPNSYALGSCATKITTTWTNCYAVYGTADYPNSGAKTGLALGYKSTDPTNGITNCALFKASYGTFTTTGDDNITVGNYSTLGDALRAWQGANSDYHIAWKTDDAIPTLNNTLFQ